MAEFEVGEYRYKAVKMALMDQFQVSRRFAPVLASMASATKGGEVKLDDMVVPLADAIAKMSDEDSAFVVNKCMAVTQRQRPGDTGWVNVWNADAKAPMFTDISLFDMLTIVGNVLVDQLGDFGSVPSLNFSR